MDGGDRPQDGDVVGAVVRVLRAPLPSGLARTILAVGVLAIALGFAVHAAQSFNF